jgi:NADPH:quinone reductase-like Zn-dependent oxidoreductase
LRSRSVEEKGVIARDLQRAVWPVLDSGRAWPLVDRTFPLAAAADAHRALEGGAVIGKVVLVC